MKYVIVLLSWLLFFSGIVAFLSGAFLSALNTK